MAEEMQVTAPMWGVIAAFISFLGILVTNLFTLLGQRYAAQQRVEAAKKADLVVVAAEKTASQVELVAAKADLASVKADEVKSTLASTNTKTESKLQEIHDLGVSTHKLVDGRLSVVLANYAKATKELAALTGESNHIEIAKEAEQASEEHKKQESIAT